MLYSKNKEHTHTHNRKSNLVLSIWWIQWKFDSKLLLLKVLYFIFEIEIWNRSAVSHANKHLEIGIEDRHYCKSGHFEIKATQNGRFYWKSLVSNFHKHYTSLTGTFGKQCNCKLNTILCVPFDPFGLHKESFTLRLTSVMFCVLYGTITNQYKKLNFR